MDLKKYQKQYFLHKHENTKLNKEFKCMFIELIELFNFIKTNNFKIVLYGYGTIGKFICNELKENIIIIVDSNSDVSNNKNILNPKYLKNYKFDFVLISSFGYEIEIEQILVNKLKIAEEKLIFISSYKKLEQKMWWERSHLIKKISINDIILNVNPSDNSALAYDSKSSFDFINNKIYSDIHRIFSPTCVIDIGSNYGFSACVFNKFFNNPELILVEANKFLIPYIEKNLAENNIEKFKLYNRICSDNSELSETFFLNPSSSQDSRVVADDNSWGKLNIQTITLSQIFENHPSDFYFIKSDTQGFERSVIMGGLEYLKNNNNWIFQIEFAPFLFEKNGIDALTFLRELNKNFNIIELPSKTFYSHQELNFIDFSKISIKDYELLDFLNYTKSINKQSIGWCDLLVFPKNK